MRLSPTSRWALAVLALVLAAVGLFSPIHLPQEQVLARMAMDLLHVPLFAGLTLVLVWAFKPFERRFTELSPPTLAAVVCTLLILLSERLQPWFGRSESLADAANGIVGIGLVWLAGCNPWRRDNSPGPAHQGFWCLFQGYRAWFGVLFLVLSGLFYGGYPLTLQIQAFRWQERSFPVLAEFASREQISLWLPQPDEGVSSAYFSGPFSGLVLVTDWEAFTWARPGESGQLATGQTVPAPSLSVAIRPGRDFTGLSLLVRGRARDWSGYNSLELEIWNNESTPRTLGIRIDDGGDVSRLSGRYQSALDLQPGANTFSLPLASIQTAPGNRDLDLGDIRRLALFTGQADPKFHHFAICSIRLNK